VAGERVEHRHIIKNLPLKSLAFFYSYVMLKSQPHSQARTRKAAITKAAALARRPRPGEVGDQSAPLRPTARVPTTA
jgi:hypothetical protein